MSGWWRSEAASDHASGRSRIFEEGVSGSEEAVTTEDHWIERQPLPPLVSLHLTPLLFPLLLIWIRSEKGSAPAVDP